MNYRNIDKEEQELLERMREFVANKKDRFRTDVRYDMTDEECEIIFFLRYIEPHLAEQLKKTIERTYLFHNILKFS